MEDYAILFVMIMFILYPDLVKTWNMGDDIDKIKDFLADLKKDLQDYVDRYDFLVPMHPEMKIYFVNAWDEVKTKFSLIDLAWNKPEVISLLKQFGLTGNQLDLKLRLIENARTEYEILTENHSYLSQRFQEEQNSDRKNALWKLLNKIRQFIIESKRSILNKDDIPLSSLISAIPLFGDPIAEFKDAAMSTLES